MSNTYTFQLTSQLNDVAQGDGKLFFATGEVPYGVPSQFGGQDGKTSPEELIMGALSSCYSMTLGFVFEKRKIPVQSVEMHAEAVVDRIERQLQLTSITLKPRIVVQEDSAQIRQDIKAAIERAERACLISNAIRGNVTLKVEEEIEVA